MVSDLQFISKIDEELTKAVKSSCNSEVGLLFSGGIDSSILAFLILKKTNCKIRLYTVGTENSYDIRNARDRNIFKLKAKEIIINENDVMNGMNDLLKMIGRMSAFEIAISLPIYFVCKVAKEKKIIYGQGADELFFGYRKYIFLSEKELKKRYAIDIKKCKNFYERDKKIASAFRKEIYAPFLDPEVIKVCENIPVDYKIKNGMRKYILRIFALSLNVPKEVVWQEKKAMQYGTGLMKIVNQLLIRRFY
ncbi:MAG: asparagine synthase C-terminal domain-containing protein [Candidatus Thermoplasmatota archaeon]